MKIVTKTFLLSILLASGIAFGTVGIASGLSPRLAFEEVEEPSISHSSSSEEETPSHSSSSSEEESTSSKSSSKSSSSSSKSIAEDESEGRPVSKPVTTTYQNRTYYYSSPYFNSGGFWVWYWIIFYNQANHPYYVCFDQNHNEISCNRNSNQSTTSHNGQTYHVSKPYKNTGGKTVAYWQQYYNKQQKKYFECFDNGYSRITCTSKK